MLPSLNLIRWEWFKLRRRWMPWILLAVVLGFSQSAFWASKAFAGTAGSFADGLLLPASIGAVLAWGNEVVAVAIIVLATSTLGSEYGLGTLRGVLVKGMGRWQFLSSAFVLMVATGFVWLLAICACMAVVGSVAGVVAGDGGFATSGQWSATLVQLGKSALAFVPYVAVAMFLTVVTTSATAALAITLAYKFLVEDVLVPILTIAVNGFDTVAGFFLGQAVRGWPAAGQGDGAPTGAFVLAGPNALPEMVPSLLVMLAYTLILVGAAAWVFQFRDIGGAKGT